MKPRLKNEVTVTLSPTLQGTVLLIVHPFVVWTSVDAATEVAMFRSDRRVAIQACGAVVR